MHVLVYMKACMNVCARLYLHRPMHDKTLPDYKIRQNWPVSAPRQMDGWVCFITFSPNSFIHSFILAISIAPIASKGLAQDPYVAARTHDPLVESHRLNQCAIMSHTNAPPRSTIFGTHRLINTCKSISFAQ